MLEIQHLSVAYGDCTVLHDISLQVPAGEVLAVIGPNGVGKSTLIRAMSGILPPKTGTIRVDGREVARLSQNERARYMAVVPQARSLPDHFTVYQTVLLGRTPYLGWMGTTGPRDHAFVRCALEQAQITHLAERWVGTLSGGEQQRVLLARALAQDTPVLLLDEPTTHLDLQHQTGLLNLVRALASEKKLAVMMVLHDMNHAAMYADRVALIVRGRVFACGSPEEVLTRANLTTIFQVPVSVIPHPDYGTPLILPDGVHAPRNQRTFATGMNVPAILDMKSNPRTAFLKTTTLNPNDAH